MVATSLHTPAARWRSGRSVWLVLGVGAALLAAILATGSLVVSAAATTAAFLIAVSAMLASPPPRRSGWWCLTLASASGVFSRIYVAAAHPSGVPNQAFHPGDLRTLIAYPLFAVGLAILPGRARESELADSLDAAIVALGIFVLLWLFLLNGELTPDGGNIVVAAVRPIGVAVVVGILARLVFLVGPRSPAVRLVVTAVTCVLFGAVALIARSVGYSFLGRITGTAVFFTAYSILLAAALVHPSVTEPLVRRQRRQARLSPTRAAVFIALTLLGPLAWLSAVIPSSFNPHTVEDLAVPMIATEAISLLLLWRLLLITRVADRRADQLGSAFAELQELQAELTYRAVHDPLTGLANRSMLNERLETMTRRAVRGRQHALLLLDLDGFKEINDTLGHPVGDELLVIVGSRLAALAPGGSTVVRLGGDEFAILLPEAEGNASLELAELVREDLSRPYATSRGELRVTTSVGLKYGTMVGESPSDVLRDADLALYAAKRAGKNRITTFHIGLGPQVSRTPRPRMT